MALGKSKPTEFAGADRRRDIREKIDLAAQIVLPTGQFVKCRVTDFSKTGARLEISGVFGLPNTFELRAGGRTFLVRVMRRGLGHVGVGFL